MKIVPGLVKKEEKVQSHEVADGYGSKVAPGQSLISRRFLECSSTLKFFMFLFEKQHIYKENIVYLTQVTQIKKDCIITKEELCCVRFFCLWTN